MEIPFTKMQSCGNDYVLIDCISNNQDPDSVLKSDLISENTLARRYGIGSDGVIVLYKSKISDFGIKVYCPDGREEKSNINAVICASKYLYDNSIIQKTVLTAETGINQKVITLYCHDDKVSSCEISGGVSSFSADFAALPIKKGIKYGQVFVNNGFYSFECVSFGDDYCVIISDDTDSLDIDKLGNRITKNISLLNVSNIALLQILTPSHIKVRAWKNGCGEILSCSDAGCACASLAVKKGLCRMESYIIADFRGGCFHIKAGRKYNMSIMGECDNIYKGTYFFDT